MAPEMVATVVVATPIVALPKIEEHTWYRAAGAVHHFANEPEAWRFCIGINKVGSLGREWGEEGALHLRRGLTSAAWGHWLLSQRLSTGQNGGRGQPEVEGEPPKALKYFSTREDGLFHEGSIWPRGARYRALCLLGGTTRQSTSTQAAQTR